MRFGRDNDLTIGDVQYRISTYLEPGEGGAGSEDELSIETVITCQNRTVFRTATEIPELRPVFKHSQEIAQRLETLHQTVLEKLKAGSLTLEDQTGGARPTEPDFDPYAVTVAEPTVVRSTAAEPPAPVQRPNTNPAIRRDATQTRRRSLGRSRGPGSSFPGNMAEKPMLIAAGGVILGLIAIATLSFVMLGGEPLPIEALEEAARLLSSEQYPEAIEAYSRILADHGELAPACVGRGRAHIASGNIEEGLADLTRAVELDPETPATAEELADVLFMGGSHEKGLDYYMKAITSGSTSADARFRLALCLVQLDRAKEALPYLEAALDIDAANKETRFLYGKLLNTEGRYADAERELRAVENLIDAGGDHYFELGFSLLKQGKLDEAEEVARDFLGFDSQDSRSHSLLGEVYLSRKQLEPARSELILALKMNPKEPRAQVALGRTWLAIGRKRGDKADLAKARQILVNAVGVPEGERLMVLGRVSLAGGDTNEALSLLERSLEQGAEPLPVRLSLAEAKITAGDLAGAAQELQRAEGLSPSDPSIALSLGLTYFQLKDARRAAEEFLKAIQGVGLTAPVDKGAGPVVLPTPHVPLPERLDINQTLRATCRQALVENEEDPTAIALQNLSSSTSFIIDGRE